MKCLKILMIYLITLTIVSTAHLILMTMWECDKSSFILFIFLGFIDLIIISLAILKICCIFDILKYYSGYYQYCNMLI